MAIMIGVFFASYARRVAHEFTITSDALFATQMALAREQKLQHLGGVVAAAAHEMGTPLATIKLIAGELQDELATALPEREDLAEDAATLAQSADRCRDIMRSMGRAGKDDLLLHAAPLQVVLEEAAEPHVERGASVSIEIPDAAPTIRRPRRDPRAAQHHPERGGFRLQRRYPRLLVGNRAERHRQR